MTRILPVPVRLLQGRLYQLQISPEIIYATYNKNKFMVVLSLARKSKRGDKRATEKLNFYLHKLKTFELKQVKKL